MTEFIKSKTMPIKNDIYTYQGKEYTKQQMVDMGLITFIPELNSRNNIATALVKAQKAFAPALKTSTNPHFRSKYADLSACIEAVMDALNDNGIALTQQLHEATGGISVETVFIHESGETLNCGKLFVPAIKQDAQGFGSALTYARRYSLMAACGIAPEDDDGNAASKPANPVVAKNATVEPTFKIDDKSLTKEQFFALIKIKIENIKTFADMEEYEEFKENNQEEIKKFCIHCPEYKAILIQQAFEKEKAIKETK
jgi:hypothetical protein